MTNFQKLVEQFAQSEALKGMEPWLSGNDVWLPEWQDFNTEYRKRRVGECIGNMPEPYKTAYGQQLEHKMDRLKLKLREQYERERLAGFDQSFSATKAADWASIMVDAVLNWAGKSIEGSPGQGVGAEEFTRFAVVVRDFYDRFKAAYDAVRKARNELPKSRKLPEKNEPPPLVTFSPSRVWGPHTINAENVSKLIKARVGVVSLPSVFAKVPLLWAPLAHEVFGHDAPAAYGLAHMAEPAPVEPGRLIPEMISELQETVAHCNEITREWRPTWPIWTEELAADLAGLLGMGPYFAIGFAAFLSATACRDPFGPPWRPGLVGTTIIARGGRAYDEHPPDLLRLYALLGAAEAVLDLGKFEKLSCSVEALETVVEAARPPSCTIDVYDFDSQSVLMRYDCDGLIRDARAIGKLIINKQFESLAGKRIIDFYSWTNDDHDKAQEVAVLVTDFKNEEDDKAQEIAALSKALSRAEIQAPHLLAGAIKAVYEGRAIFRRANDFLNVALLLRAPEDKPYEFKPYEFSKG